MNTREETYHMTDKEMARLIVAERLIEGEITIKGAAEVLKLSTRQVKRIKKGVRLIGPKAVIHGNRKRKPVNVQRLCHLKVYSFVLRYCHLLVVMLRTPLCEVEITSSSYGGYFCK